MENHTVYILVDGHWSSWGSWSGCSVSCGNGTRTRSHHCVFAKKKPHGKNCTGPVDNTEACFDALCPGKKFLYEKSFEPPIFLIFDAPPPKLKLKIIKFTEKKIKTRHSRQRNLQMTTVVNSLMVDTETKVLSDDYLIKSVSHIIDILDNIEKLYYNLPSFAQTHSLFSVKTDPFVFSYHGKT